MMKLLFAAVILALSVPAAAAFAEDDDHRQGHRSAHREHRQVHREANRDHREAHQDGFRNRRDHREYHRDTRDDHNDFHDDHPGTRHDDRRRGRSGYNYQPSYGSPYGYSYAPYGYYPQGRRW